MKTPRSSWLRFRVRSLLVLIALAAFALVWQANQARRRQRAIDHLVSRGATVHTAEIGPPWLRHILPEAWLEDAWSVDFELHFFRSPPARSRGGAFVSQLSELETYFFMSADQEVGPYPRPPLPADAWTSLRTLRRCQALMLNRWAVTDDELASLPPDLLILHLEHTSITDAAVPALARQRKLQHLEIGGTHITAAGLAQLQAALPQTHISHWLH